MNERQIADQIIDRSRTILGMNEVHPRTTLKSALIDVCVSTAIETAINGIRLVEQCDSTALSQRLRTMRRLLVSWRKILRYVKAVNKDHPISERHLYLAFLELWGDRLNDYEKLFDPACLALKYLYYERLGRQSFASFELSESNLRGRIVTARNRMLELLDSMKSVA